MPLIAALQMVSGPHVEANLLEAERLIARAADAGAKLVVLPENFALMGRREADKVAARETPGDGPLQHFLAAQAARHQLWLVGGTIPLAASDDRRVRASCLLYDDQGRLAARYDKTRADRVKDLARYPELVFLDRFGMLVPLVFAAVLFAAGGLPALLWGFFVPVVLAWHVTFSINSVAHVLGSRRYPTADDSRNNPVLALLTFGEGWHNNHHFYASTANQGWFWWELDLSYLALRGLASVGLVWDLRTPPAHVRAGRLPVRMRPLQEDGVADGQVGVEHAL